MEKHSHLSDEQWAAAVLNQSGAAVPDQRSGCVACREEVELLAEAMGIARAEIDHAADRPESFWRQQREGITTRWAARLPHPPWKRWVWVTAAVMLVLVATTLLSKRTPPRLPEASRTDPDDALLLSVQQSIRSDLPQALRPAALLAQEMDRAAAWRRSP